MGPGLHALRLLGRQAWLPGRGRMLRLLAGPQRIGNRPFDVDFFGLRFRGNTDSLIDWSVFFLGAYSRDELVLLRDVGRALRKQRGRLYFYDVGANVGNHTLYMSLIADAVVAFEPHPGNRARLQQHVHANRLRNVRVLPCALGDRTGSTQVMVYDGANHGGACIVAEGGEAAELVRGDDLVAAGLPPVDLLKADVEGYESRVLAGLRSTLLRDRPVILLELTGEVRSGFNTRAGLLASLPDDYHLHAMGPRRWGLPSYRLRPFNIEAGMVLCVPAELRWPS